MSSTKTEYVAATTGTCHLVVLRILLKDMGHTKNSSPNITYFIEKTNTLTLPIISFVSESIMDKFPYYFVALRSSWITCSSRTFAFDYQRKQLGIDNDADLLRLDYGGVSSHLVTHSIFCPMVFTHGIVML